MTIARVHDKLDRGFRIDQQHVLVVDEAGMAGTRQLAPILDNAAEHGGKVVLVGDPKQLPEIHAGGLLAELDRRLPTIRLAENRRQHNPAEVEALDHLRHGRVERALSTFVDQDRTVGTNSDAVRQTMVDDWWHHLGKGADALMMAPRWADADDLNRRARHHLRAAGRLEGDPIIVGERPYEVGDRVMCLRNDYHRGLRNGMVGTVTSINHEHRHIALETDDGRRILPADYLDAGHIRHGYAVTVHKAQGSTCDHALVLGSDELYREMGYVGLSCGRLSNRMYLVDGAEQRADREVHATPNQPEGSDVLAAAREALATSRAKKLATSRADQLESDLGIDIGP